MKLLKGNNLLNANQCNALRGIAIIGIFLHNFCHWLKPGIILENEYNFTYSYSRQMWDYLTKGGIDGFFPIQFFSFFGHYGVPIFLFLSGFGLVMKYENTSHKASALQFIKYQWNKLFRLMLLGFFVTLFTHGVYGSFSVDYGLKQIVSELLLVINVLPRPELNIIPGPYWFFGLMFQVYIMYRLIIYPVHHIKTGRWKMLRWLIPVLLVLITWGIQVALVDNSVAMRYVRYNVFVAVLPFSVGVLMGRYGFPRMSKWALATIAIIAIVVLMIANLNFYSWLWGPLLVIAGSTSFVKLFEAKDSRLQSHLDTVMRPLVWTGVLSSCIFAVHSIVRLPIFLEVLWRQPEVSPTVYLWIVLYIVLTLLLARGYQYYLKLYPKPRLKTN